MLLADHGMNASTFTARVIASTESDLASGIVGGIGALKGPLHGGAPCAGDGHARRDRHGGNIEPWVDHALDGQQKLMGFGHRVYKHDRPARRDSARDGAPGLHA